MAVWHGAPWRRRQDRQDRERAERQAPTREGGHAGYEEALARGELGSYGQTSAELPAITREELARWNEHQQRVQRARTLALRRIRGLYQGAWISRAVYDLLHVEMQQGAIPDVRWENDSGGYHIWSGVRQQWYSLAAWERQAQALLPIDDPERETELTHVTAPPLSPPLPASSFWPPALNSRHTPPPAPRPFWSQTPAPWLHDLQDAWRDDPWHDAPPITPAPTTVRLPPKTS